MLTVIFSNSMIDALRRIAGLPLARDIRSRTHQIKPSAPPDWPVAFPVLFRWLGNSRSRLRFPSSDWVWRTTE